VLNPFTPFGDCSLIRIANLYANIAQVGAQGDVRECFNMITERSAKLMRLKHYGIAVGKAADLLVFDCLDPATAVAELVAPMYGFKRGRQTFTRTPVAIHRPQ
jgi:cytosine deaminase